MYSCSYFRVLVVVLLIKVNVQGKEGGIGMKRNPLTYFQLESMLNYDILLLYNSKTTGKHPDEFQVLTTTFALTNGEFQSSNYDEEELTFHNVITLINPANTSSINNFIKQIAASSVENLSHRYIFLIWPFAVENRSDIPSILKNIIGADSFFFHLDSNIFVIFQYHWSLFGIWEIYAIKDEQFIQPVGVFVDKIDIADILDKSSRRDDFGGVEIVGIASNRTSYADEAKFANNSDSDTELTFKSGFAVSLYWDMRDMLNFSESALPGGWMFIYNGTLAGGQAEALLSDEADLCISQNVMRTDLASRLTFLLPTSDLSVIAFFKEPSLGNLVEIYNEPFNLQVWISLVILILGIIGLVNIFIKFLRPKGLTFDPDRIFKNESILWMIATSCQQGWHSFPSALPLRILFTTGSLTAFVVYSAYSAALVSKLSVQMSPIQSFKDLLRYDYTFVFNKQSVSLMEYAKGMRKYYNIRRVNHYDGDEIGRYAMQRQTTVLSYWEAIEEIYPVSNKIEYICNSLQTFPVENTPVHTGMTLKKGSPYREIFNLKILQLKERGFNYRYWKHYEWATQPQCLKLTAVRHEKLDLRSICSAHFLLLAGLIGAPLTLLLELLLYKREKQNRHILELAQSTLRVNSYLYR